MSYRKRLNFTADESQKERWETFIDESEEYDSLSEFFRRACEHEIERGHPLEEQNRQLPRRVANELEALQEQIDELQSEVAWIRQQIHDEKDLNEVAREVHRHLPTSAEDVMLRHAEQSTDGSEFVNTGSLEDLAHATEKDERLVEDAITFLRNNFVEVAETTTEHGTTHYYRVE